MDDELKYQLALKLIPQIGDVTAKILLSKYGSAKAIFEASLSRLEQTENVGRFRAKAIKNFSDFERVEEEMVFIEKHQIQPLFYTYNNYPKRLKSCYDSPPMLFLKGDADLNASRIISIIGTRSSTNYGRTITENIINELAAEHISIISGMAYGIDICAHKAALENNLPTVAVLAHGLDRLYPAMHKTTATDMMNNGGLLTDYISGTKPDKQNFPRRNRIVAGLADAVVVIESGIKGGSLITAEIASSYNRDVFAVPGRVDDTKSSGCNFLIKSNKAALVTSGKDILQMMNWDINEQKTPTRQRTLFIDPSEEEAIILKLFEEQEVLHIDQICLQSELSSSKVAGAMLNLEMQQVLQSLPGKLYKLL